MQSFKQTQSKQFTRHFSIQPITRTSSFHNLDHKKKQTRASKIRHVEAPEANVHLANIVHQILEKKPKTAALPGNKRNQGKRRGRVETIGDQCNNPDFFGYKVNPISLLNIIKGQKQRQDEQEMKYKLLQIDGKNKNTLQKNATSRTKNHQQPQTNHQLLNYPQIKRGKSSTKQINPKYTTTDTSPKDDDPQFTNKQIQKHSTDKIMIPKAKLTIKNVDKFVSIEFNKQKKLQHKNSGMFKLDLKKKQTKNVSVDKDKDKTRDLLECQVGDKKVKKQGPGYKVPDFIKASLEVYKHQSDFVNNCVKIANPQPKEPDPTPLQFQSQKFQQEPREVILTQNSQSNLMNAKLKLHQKQKKRTTRIGDYIRSKRQSEQVEQPQDLPAKKKKKKSKSKKKIIEIYDNFPQQICGWQQTDLPADLDFKADL